MKNGIAILILSAVLFAFVSSPWPEDEVALGERLFSDPILSLDSSISCASCHIPAFAFADTARLSRGVGGTLGKRNSPSITNMAARAHFFYDGRARSLEQQILMPIQDALEMQLSLAEAVTRLSRHPVYAPAFRQIYGKLPNDTLLSAALAAFVRTLETSDSPFDRWMADQPGAMSEAAVRGRRVFMKKGKCFDCHFSPDFTGDEFRNVGTYNGRNLNDPGRFEVTRDSADLGKFKVPGLRNVALTAPYMHNGMFRTLEEVIDFYDNPDKFVPDAVNRDSLLAQPLNLSAQEKSDLKAFLEALTDDRFSKR